MIRLASEFPKFGTESPESWEHPTHLLPSPVGEVTGKDGFTSGCGATRK